MDAGKCASCGFPFTTSVNFCPDCGKKVLPMVFCCKKCGKTWPPTTRFCGECGTKNMNPQVVKTSQESLTKETAKDDKKNSTETDELQENVGGKQTATQAESSDIIQPGERQTETEDAATDQTTESVESSETDMNPQVVKTSQESSTKKTAKDDKKDSTETDELQENVGGKQTATQAESSDIIQPGERQTETEDAATDQTTESVESSETGEVQASTDTCDKTKTQVALQFQSNNVTHKQQHTEQESGQPPTPVKKNQDTIQLICGAPDQFCKVTFNVVISSEFKFSITEDKLQIQFQHLQFETAMSLKRTETQDKVTHYVMELILYIRKMSLFLESKLLYSYAVSRKDKLYKEFLMGNKNQSRMLRVIAAGSSLVPAEWHQYDGMVQPTPQKDWWQFWPKDTFANNNILSVQMLLPKWECFIEEENPSPQTIKQVLSEIEKVETTMKPLFVDKNGKYDGGKQFRKALQEYLGVGSHRLQQHQQMVEKGLQISSRNKVMDIVTALTIVYLTVRFKLKIQEAATNGAVFFALAVRPNNRTKTCLEYKEVLHIWFISLKKELAEYMLEYIRNMVTDSYCLPFWILAVPLIHFLHSESIPFQPVPPLKTDLPHEHDMWWGIVTVKDVVSKYQHHRANPNMMSIDLCTNFLVPMFELDPFLPRTLMSVLSPCHLQELFIKQIFAPEVCLAKLSRVIGTSYYSTPNLETIENLLQPVKGLLLSNIEAPIGDMNLDLAKSYETVMIALNCLRTVLGEVKSTKMYHVAELAVSTVIFSIERMGFVLKQESSRQGEIKKHVQCLAETLSNWCHWILQNTKLTRTFKRNGNAYTELGDQFELKIYGWLVSVEFRNAEDTNTFWKERISGILEHRLQQVSAHERMELCGKLIPKDCHPAIKQQIFKCVLNDMMNENKIKRDSIKALLESTPNKAEASAPEHWFSTMFIDSWPKDNGKISEDKQKIVKHILGWPPFRDFLILFYQNDGSSSMLTNDCYHLMEIAAYWMHQIQGELLSGNIKLDMLKQIVDNSTSFVSTYQVIKGNNEATEAKAMSLTLVKRKKELELFTLQRRLVKRMVSFCSQIPDVPVDTSKLQEKLNRDKKTLVLSDVCNTESMSNSYPEQEIQDPVVTYFDLSDGVTAMAESLAKYNNTSLFRNIWVSFGMHAHAELGKQGNCPLMLEEVAAHVWKPMCEEITIICDELRNGTLNLTSVDKLFAEYQEKYSELKNDLKKLCQCKGECGWLDSQVGKVKQYHKLNRCKEAAEKMKRVVQVLGLTGDFKVLDTVSSVENNTTCLNDISEHETSAGRDLLNVNKEMADCIGVVGQCQDLVNWLRELKGTREVTVLVDLAMMLVQGQDAYELEKVQCLSDAAMGYAPLIYELPPDADFSLFLAQCQVVWKTLDNSPDLPERMRVSARHLEWLKEVKKAHRYTETNSLSQVQTINSRGIFKVGNIGKHSQTLAMGQEDQTLDKVIKLLITLESRDGPSERKDNGQSSTSTTPSTTNPTEPNVEVREFSLEELNDLQSRLMLVVGMDEQTKPNVERFVEIMNRVTSLGKLYMELCSAGCIIFKTWKATFHCDQSRQVTADIDFGLSKKILHSSPGETMISQLKMLCTLLEECLKEFLQDISQKREEFYHLNYFTTKQLVILRTELAEVCTQGGEGKPEIYALLHAVKPGCTYQDIWDAMQAAFKKLIASAEHAATNSADKCAKSGNQVAGEETSKETQAKEVFIQKMMKSRFSKSLALLALDHVPCTDPSKGVLWCMKHRHLNVPEPEKDVEAPEHPDTESVDRSFPGWSGLDLSSLMKRDKSLDVNRSLLEASNEPNSPLIKQLKRLWTQHMKQSGTSSVSDFLSLQHLGLILEELSRQNKQSLDRPFPEGFAKGKPNLVICPQDEVLASVLSLYIYGEGRNLPLPSTSEVLMCNPDTSAEEVDLLLQRCFHCAENKLFCLVNADLLKYDVSSHTKDSYKKLSRLTTRKLDFCLAVVCSSEHSGKSSLVTAFSTFRIKNQFVCTAEEIQAYLKDKFSVKGETFRSIDPESISVRMVQSYRAGAGKSLKVARFAEQMEKCGGKNIHISTYKRCVDTQKVMQKLLPETQQPDQHNPKLIHIDIAPEVQEGVDELLFSLLILGQLTAHSGHVWLRSKLDFYVVEVLPLMKSTRGEKDELRKSSHLHMMLLFLPKLTCWNPNDSIFLLEKIREQEGNEKLHLSTHPDYQWFDQLMDHGQFESESWQRVYQYLLRYQSGFSYFVTVHPSLVEGTPEECIKTLLRHCGLTDPSWAELRHFVHFLDIQLKDCEQSIYTSLLVSLDLPGFKLFVVKLMIQMSRDFATRSLKISEETPQMRCQQQKDSHMAGIEEFQIKRTWESSRHPYLFFNSDHHSFTFLGFHIDEKTFNMMDDKTMEVLEENAMTELLHRALKSYKVPLQESFDKLTRAEKIAKLCSVIGNDNPGEYDETYVLTTDNAKKILAIYMRFRCSIPVIIMGETGCGKTRLVRFLCELQKPRDVNVQNLVLMKVHGGTTETDLRQTIDDATTLARENKKNFPHMYTVLFFDEANTTEEIGLIKQVMSDQILTRDHMESGLMMVAACNPYRRHSDEMVKKLEAAGLGYHISADETTDRLGKIPLRQLVYRVHALPQSLLPLVWDFGTLDTDTEEMYIKEMVSKFISMEKLPSIENLTTVVSRILVASQNFMRQQKDECSFVSLREVERVLSVMAWFYQHKDVLYSLMNCKAEEEFGALYQRDGEKFQYKPPGDVTRSLVLSLGVCYQACLHEKRGMYRDHVAQHFTHPLHLTNGAQTIEKEIDSCQEVFLSHVSLEDNIARNQALKENVFMMVVCIELRIPLFLVGKPGSSKSLAKTIVADAMQGDTSKTDLFKRFKFAQMVSFQCSPLSTPEGIAGVFHHCAILQQKKELQKYVAVVVLDEVGLAEDSSRMPLKTLHPLLEDGCQGNEKPEPYKKVAFIGISNWALDPAKMNRGIILQRGGSELQELITSARGICSGNATIDHTTDELLEPLAKGYLKVLEIKTEAREFFGLRDFYSMVKMVNAFAKRSNPPQPTWHEVKYAILRNFGGLDKTRPIEVFEEEIEELAKDEEKKDTDLDCSAGSLIKDCLSKEGLKDIDSQSRYLLILTENYGALQIIEHHFLKLDDTVIIFGSSFPRDQEYTKVCYNINRIKICMETGKTVVLLNLQNLYESLYDAFNQVYMKMGDQKFVDLGLGTHRVKCRVHKDSRLIVVADKQTVYKTFPIPLINRLEKHILTMETMLSEQQLQLTKQLEKWMKTYSKPVLLRYIQGRHQKLSEGDVFIGFDKDTVASVVLQVTEKLATIPKYQQKQSSEEKQEDTKDREIDEEKVMEQAKELLLHCATPESVLLLKHTNLKSEKVLLAESYFNKQTHDNLAQFLQCHLKGETEKGFFAQITTHSRLLSVPDKLILCPDLDLKPASVWLQSLHAFDTEQQFTQMLRDFFGSSTSRLLILQCASGDEHATMIASARYNVQRESVEKSGVKFVLLVVQLPRKAGGCFVGFQGGKWLCYHIDDLHPDEEGMPTIYVLQKHSIATLFSMSLSIQDRGNNDAVTAMAQPHLHIATNEERQTEPSSVYIKDEMDNEIFKLAEDRKTINSTEAEKVCNVAQQQYLDIDKILRNCVHAAVAKLEEENVSSQCKIERVSLLLKLMEMSSMQANSTVFSDEKNFLMVMKSRVALLLRDIDEEHDSPERATEWLTNHAALPQVIVKARTLRNSVRQHIEAKVTQALAAVLAYSCADSNLDLMTSEDTPNWLRCLWLDMLNADSITRLKFRKISELSHIKIIQHGYQGSTFKCKVPFSWIIKRIIEELIQNMGAIKGDEKLESLISQHFPKTPLSQILGKLQPVIHNELVQRYLHDFVAMGHYPESKSDEEIQLFCDGVLNAAAQEQGINGDENFNLDLPTIHLVWSRIQPRVQLVEQVLKQWPGALKEILKFREKEPQHPLNTGREFTLDIQVLKLLLQHLRPTSNENGNASDELDNSDQSRQAWVARVDRFANIVERLFVNLTRTGTFFKEAWHLWSRISAVRLLTQYTVGVDECTLLWEFLPKETDFKSITSVQQLEEFLQTSNTMAINHYLGSVGNCPNCIQDLDDPVLLPCGHRICIDCVKQLKSTGEGMCPECRTSLPEELDNSTVEAEKQEAFAKYQNYKKQCNAFYMAVVSQLCFHSNTPPENEVIRHLLNLITQKPKDATEEASGTKQMGPVKDWGAVDATPVVRSFLLQMLLRSHFKDVEQHIDQYFESCRDVDTLEVVQLFVYCLEDSIKSSPDEVANQLKTYTKELTKQDLRVTKLMAVASVRYCLSLVATLMAEETIDQEVLDATEGVCACGTDGPRLYLLRQVNRCYGISKLQEVIARTGWLQDSETQITRQPDRYLVYERKYTSICLALGKFLKTGEEEEMLLSTEEQTTQQELFLCLYTEVTLSNLNEKHKINTDILDKLNKVLTEQVAHKQLVSDLIQNRLARHNTMMTVIPGEADLVTMVREMLVHLLVILTTGEDSNLTQPLRLLATKPQQMHQRFLPTMPQDDLVYANEVLQSIEQLQLYKCSNGHPYTIGECGRPWKKGKCIECGEVIGGELHRLESGNERMESATDNTLHGHILGPPANRQREAIPERKLSPATTSLLRILTHMAMSLGANEHPDEVKQLIVPNIAIDKLHKFLYNHITCDLEAMESSLCRSVEDCVLLVNLVIRNIGMDDGKYNDVDGSLQSKEARETWEDKFSTTYLQPILQNMSAELAETHRKQMEDHRICHNQFLRQVYEADTLTSFEPDLEHIEEMPVLWRLREKVTFEALLQEVNRKAEGQSQKTLQLFLTQLHKLSELRLLLNIVQLQQLLVQQFSGVVSNADASSKTLRDILMDLPQDTVSEEANSLMNNVFEAWKLLRDHLKKFSFEGKSLPINLCEMEINKDSKLAMLLPTWKGQGLCSLAMVHYLCAVQNKFLEEYAEIMNIQLPDPVSIQYASEADLVSVHPDRELLPLVVAGCNYSVTKEKGLTHSYDLETIAREVRERFVRGRSKLLPKVPTVQYREDFTTAKKFVVLNEKVKQEHLPEMLLQQIHSETIQITYLSQSLESLNVVIAFLMSAGGNKDMSLGDFMVNKLEMKRTVHSSRAMQHCTLSHVKYLWVAFSHQIARIQAKFDQYPFDHIPSCYCEDVPSHLKLKLHEVFTNTNMLMLMEGLYEYILLGLKDKDQPINTQTDDEEDTEQILSHTIYAFLESSDGDPPPILTDSQKFPDQLLVKHVVSTWMEAFRYQKAKGKK